jgi:hypothetical protein
MNTHALSGETEEDMTFGEIYGHEKQIAILKNAMANDRIAHAISSMGWKESARGLRRPFSPRL